MEKKELEREKRALDGKISQLGDEIEAKNSRIDEIESSKRELDDMVKESALSVKKAEALAKESEEKSAQSALRLGQEIKRREADKALAEETAVKLVSDIEMLKTVIVEKEKAETELRDLSASLRADIESRDQKIERDIKYCEGLLKEINDLRKRSKSGLFRAK